MCATDVVDFVVDFVCCDVPMHTLQTVAAADDNGLMTAGCPSWWQFADRLFVCFTLAVLA